MGHSRRHRHSRGTKTRSFAAKLTDHGSVRFRTNNHRISILAERQEVVGITGLHREESELFPGASIKNYRRVTLQGQQPFTVGAYSVKERTLFKSNYALP